MVLTLSKKKRRMNEQVASRPSTKAPANWSLPSFKSSAALVGNFLHLAVVWCLWNLWSPTRARAGTYKTTRQLAEGRKGTTRERQWTTGPGPCLGEERGKKLHSSNFHSLKELVKQRSYCVFKMTRACCFLVNNEGGVSLRSRELLLPTQRHNHSQTTGLGYSNTTTVWGVCADLLKGIIVLLTPLLPACISAAFSEDP